MKQNHRRVDSKPSSLNARKHGLTSRIANSTTSHSAKLKLAEALSQGSGHSDVTRAAEQLADILSTIASIRREKASLINHAVSQAGGSEATDALEAPEQGECAGAIFPRGEEGNDIRRSSNTRLDFLETEAILANIQRLETLDSYERRNLSRRRKAAFALLRALEIDRRND